MDLVIRYTRQIRKLIISEVFRPMMNQICIFSPTRPIHVYAETFISITMGFLPDTQNCECACAGNAGNVFPVTAGKRSRHASRHVRHARAVMHAGIAN